MLTYAMKSRQGSRNYNEDYIQMHDEVKASMFVLADGLGGCGHGELASRTAVNSVICRFRRGEENEAPPGLDELMENAQKAVMLKQEMVPEAANMCTTLVILKIENNTAKWCHIGDSRLYMFRDGQVAFQTLDHSVPQMLVRMGEIKPEDIRKHPDRNRLLHIVEKPWVEQKYVVAEPVELKKGDAFLLCSDGFWEYIVEDEMCSILRQTKYPDEWLERMTEVVEKNGRGENMDNYSAICVRV